MAGFIFGKIRIVTTPYAGDEALATAPLGQEPESSTIVFLVPVEVLRMPLAY